MLPCLLAIHGFMGSTVMKWASGSVARLPCVFSRLHPQQCCRDVEFSMGLAYGDSRDNVAEDPDAFRKNGKHCSNDGTSPVCCLTLPGFSFLWSPLLDYRAASY